MISQRIETFTHDDRKIQKVQVVSLNGSELSFFKPQPSEKAFERLCELYENFISRRYGDIIGKVVLFRLPADLEIPYPESGRYGKIFDRTAWVNALFTEKISCHNGELVFKDEPSRKLFRQLQERNCLKIVQGKRSFLFFLPVGNDLGFLSEGSTCELKVNASFFVMDPLDLGSVYDRIGTPIGLCVQDGKILNPPSFQREVFFIDSSHKAGIRDCSLKELTVIIDGVSYRHGSNARFYQRPQRRKTPFGGFDLVIVNNQVVAVKEGGHTAIPSGGFIIKIRDKIEVKDYQVSYQGLADCRFAIQVGNSVVRDGVISEHFISPFYDYRKFWKTAYPPSLYPLNYEKDRAPRIVLGADEADRLYLLWFEGAGKFGYRAETDSCGASLSECARFSKLLGIHNGINLDGGGSAEILLRGRRYLKISDRDPLDFSEKERSIPWGLAVK